ncbi:MULTISPECIES: hypothetical protein [unclassified Myxococcus]|uniref:hypothetical protein n=1 Tax=unclassified Myxococcus TaxID=2648731 RepID=UPI0020CD4785|nr:MULTISPECIES: hypothetical protein [unclassified Myxococcus]
MIQVPRVGSVRRVIPWLEQRAEEEAHQREDAERRVAELQVELERVRASQK